MGFVPVLSTSWKAMNYCKRFSGARIALFVAWHSLESRARRALENLQSPWVEEFYCLSNSHSTLQRGSTLGFKNKLSVFKETLWPHKHQSNCLGTVLAEIEFRQSDERSASTIGPDYWLFWVNLLYFLWRENAENHLHYRNIYMWRIEQFDHMQFLWAIAEYSAHPLVLQKTALTQTKTLTLYVRKQDLNSSLAAVC